MCNATLNDQDVSLLCMIVVNMIDWSSCWCDWMICWCIECVYWLIWSLTHWYISISPNWLSCLFMLDLLSWFVDLIWMVWIWFEYIDCLFWLYDWGVDQLLLNGLVDFVEYYICWIEFVLIVLELMLWLIDVFAVSLGYVLLCLVVCCIACLLCMIGVIVGWFFVVLVGVLISWFAEQSIFNLLDDYNDVYSSAIHALLEQCL